VIDQMESSSIQTKERSSLTRRTKNSLSQNNNQREGETPPSFNKERDEKD